MVKSSVKVLAFATLALACSGSVADAVVYCRAVGVPKGCVARPRAVAPRLRTPGWVLRGRRDAGRRGRSSRGRREARRRCGAPGVG